MAFGLRIVRNKVAVNIPRPLLAFMCVVYVLLEHSMTVNMPKNAPVLYVPPGDCQNKWILKFCTENSQGINSSVSTLDSLHHHPGSCN